MTVREPNPDYRLLEPTQVVTNFHGDELSGSYQTARKRTECKNSFILRDYFIRHVMTELACDIAGFWRLMFY